MPFCGRGDAVNLRELSFTLVVSIPAAKSIELRKLLVSASRIVEQYRPRCSPRQNIRDLTGCLHVPTGRHCPRKGALDLREVGGKRT